MGRGLFVIDGNGRGFALGKGGKPMRGVNGENERRNSKDKS
jgi:hypothetical protein